MLEAFVNQTHGNDSTGAPYAAKNLEYLGLAGVYSLRLLPN